MTEAPVESIASAMLNDARRWLRSHPVPPAPGPRWNEWREAASRLSHELAEAFVAVLSRGDDREQYGAMLVLREFGIEVWAEGDGDDLHYTVTHPGQEPVIVKPASTVPDLTGDATKALEREALDALIAVSEARDAAVESTGAPAASIVEQLAGLRVVEGLRHASRVWRDVYVATRVGDAIADGKVDLVYERDGGLHVVEVKAAPVELADRQRELVLYATGLAEVLKEPVEDVTVLVVRDDQVDEVLTALPQTSPRSEEQTHTIVRLAG